MKNAEKSLQSYINSEKEEESDFQKFIKNINQNKIREDKEKFLLFLRLLISISKHQHRFEQFFDKIEKILATQINECFGHPKFSELPVSSIYRIIERSSEENVDINLLVDFILKSSTTFFTLFKFVDFQRLTEDKIECLFNSFDTFI